MKQRLEARVREMQPKKVVRELRMPSSPAEPSVAVCRDEVLHDGAGFAEHQLSIRDDRRRANRMQGLVLRRREARARIPLVALELIVKPELLAQPDDALGLRPAEVMDGQHRAARHCAAAAATMPF